jgi:hypothetical protein
MFNCCCVEDEEHQALDVSSFADLAKEPVPGTVTLPATDPPPEPVREPPPEPVAQPVAPLPEAKTSLTIEFDGGTVQLFEKPFGIGFTSVTPLAVKSIESGGVAHSAGVKAGWVFKKIGDVSVEGKDMKEILDVLKSAAQPLAEAAPVQTFAPGTLVIEFEMGGGVFKKFGFTKQPLGLQPILRKTAEGKISAVVDKIDGGSHAEELGVQEGWVFRKIGGQDLTDKTVDDVKDLLVRGSAALVGC